MNPQPTKPLHTLSKSAKWQLLLTVIVFLLGPSLVSAAEFFDFYQPVQPPRDIQVMVHRGVISAAPENTIPAFQTAVELGFEWIEIDVRLTSDGQHVLLHDHRLDRTTNGSGPVHENTAAEIKQLDAGSWFAERFKGEKVPTLKEALAFCKNKVNVYLDCKSVNPELLVQEIRETEMQDQVVVFDSPDKLQQINRLSNNTIPVMPSINGKLDPGYWIDLLHPAVVEIHAELITKELVQTFHDAGVIVQAQVLGNRDKPEVWRACMDMDVDWYQTDQPELVLAEYVQRRIGDKQRVKVSAHRGENVLAPENTLPAYIKAIDQGVDFIEIDTRTTKDGQIVSIHDSDVDRTTDGKGKVRSLTLEEIQKLSAGAWFGAPYAEERVPTLETICSLVTSHHGPNGRVALYVDMKDADPEQVVKILHQYALIQTAVFYGSPQELQPLRKFAPDAKLMPGFGNPDDLQSLAENVKPYALDTRWTILSKDLIQNAHGFGIKIFSDAMNVNDDFDAFLDAMDWGIDTIQTDRISRVFRAIDLKLNQ